MRQLPKSRRTKGSEREPSMIKDKFLEKREESVRVKPLVPMNDKQALYMELLEDLPIVVATGFAGTSKTYLSVAVAADNYKVGKVKKIIFTRPAISSSQTLGYFSGDATQKMEVWLGAVVPILKARLGVGMYENALSKKDIEFVPLEVVKGLSINDAFMICEEASDLSKDEVIKLVTRMGKNSTLVLAGDCRQTELRERSGLVWLTDFIERYDMDDLFGWVDFNSTDDIVRSDAVKRFLVNLVRDEKKGAEV
jgi:phosphate starvation-inducible PhoH-like protein